MTLPPSPFGEPMKLVTADEARAAHALANPPHVAPEIPAPVPNIPAALATRRALPPMLAEVWDAAYRAGFAAGQTYKP